MLGQYGGEDIRIPSLAAALARCGTIDVMLDPRMPAEQLVAVHHAVREAGFDPVRLLFCVYNAAEARELVRLFPESVLLWKLRREFDCVHQSTLEEIGLLGLDGLMLHHPLCNEDISSFMNALRERKLRVLFYVHGGAGYPHRRWRDQPDASLRNMVAERVDYVTTNAVNLPTFAELVGQEA